MKKYLLFLTSFILIIGLSSCAQETVEEPVPTDLPLAPFSYEDTAAQYKDGDAGVNPYDFVNVDKYPIDDQISAVDRAANECTIEYNSTAKYYDYDTGMWRIDFLEVERLGQASRRLVYNCQSVYLDSDGITQLIVYEE